MSGMLSGEPVNHGVIESHHTEIQLNKQYLIGTMLMLMMLRGSYAKWRPLPPRKLWDMLYGSDVTLGT